MGTGARASCMLGKYTELHPRPRGIWKAAEHKQAWCWSGVTSAGCYYNASCSSTNNKTCMDGNESVTR